MGSIRRGWALAKTSWGVLRSDRSLAVFPVLGGLGALLPLAVFGIPSAVLFDDDRTVPAVILAGIAIYLATAVGVFFNVALAAAAAQVLDGEDATVASGVAVARSRAAAVAGWAGMVASVNIVIRALQQRAGFVGDLLLGGLAVAWSLVTFLVIPVIALEDAGPIEALKRSAGIFRQRWGEQATGMVSIGGLVLLATVIPAAVLVAIGVLVGEAVALGVLIALAVIIVLVGMIVASAMTQIFAVALYRFATAQGATGAFTEAELSSAVRSRPARGTI